MTVPCQVFPVPVSGVIVGAAVMRMAIGVVMVLAGAVGRRRDLLLGALGTATDGATRLQSAVPLVCRVVAGTIGHGA
jgi:hypothetical protein